MGSHMSNSFQSYRRLVDRLDQNNSLEIEQSWRQGRTAYGGLTTALSLAAITRNFPDLPPLRTFQITFVGPVGETPRFETSRLRQGRNITSIEAKTINDDQTNASGVFMFGANRESSVFKTQPSPSQMEPESCEDFIPEQAKPFVPKFVTQFDTRLVAGHRPMTAAKDGYILAWARHAHPDSRQGTDAFTCLADVLPGAAAPMVSRPAPMSSMNWQMNFLKDDVVTDDGWYLVETKLSAALGGYSSQVMRFWNKKGEMIAEGTQSFAIFS